MHEPYKNRLQHKADFRVSYLFRGATEGGRKTGEPFQGIRSDLSYDERSNKLFMIWPEFEDEEGNVILSDDEPVLKSGTARMWIVDPKMRPFHFDKITLGTRCYFREGAMVTAECEVIEILDLFLNPIN